MINLSIIVPVHNEVLTIGTLIESWNKELIKISNLNFEFVLVEDGSTDGTKELIRTLENKYPILNLKSEEKRGYSKAVLDGIYHAKNKYICCIDGDNQIRVESLIQNIPNIPKVGEFVIGKRSPRVDSLKRIIYSKLFKLIHDMIIHSGLSDPSCPFVIGRKEDFFKLPKKLLLRMREGFWWGFVAVCKKKKINLREVEVKHFKREFGEAGYQLINLPGIIFRNIFGLIKIKTSKDID